MTTNTVADQSGGNPLTSSRSASTPPADVPTTTMSRSTSPPFPGPSGRLARRESWRNLLERSGLTLGRGMTLVKPPLSGLRAFRTVTVSPPRARAPDSRYAARRSPIERSRRASTLSGIATRTEISRRQCMRSGSRRWTWLLVLPLALAADAVAAPAGRSPATLGAFSHELESVAARIAPAVVQINVTAYGPPGSGAQVTEELLGRERRGGSGFLISPDGYILTNAHVVEGAHRLRVMVALPSDDSPRRSLIQRAGRSVEARVIGVDHETDLAVLKVEGKQLPHLTFADSDALEPGEVVLAFGSPLGLENSVTMGVISSVAR
ncbi:MAG: trypsin-like serine protease, partial [Candidatus Eisenbacteria bacterium]